MSHADFSALATSWHDFYLTAGAAAAALIGLLFALRVVLTYLTSAADSAWDLLIEVGRERRRRAS